MEDITAQTSNPVEFVIPEHVGYAMIPIQICDAAEFLMTKLEPVEQDEIAPDDRECAICQDEFSNEHAPVQTPCGHYFGEKCIMRWLDPLCFWRNDFEDHDADENISVFEMSKTSCPKCRTVFFGEHAQQDLEALTQRLFIWDVAYHSAGVRRSIKEEGTRKHLKSLVEYCETSDDWEPRDCEQEYLLEYSALCHLLVFSTYLKITANLTPEQENLRVALERIGRKVPGACVREDDLTWKFDINSDLDERPEFRNNPMQKAQLESDWETDDEEEAS